MSKARKSIFITGAAAGIGRATALRFAAAGWRVGLYDVNLIGLKALASEIGPQAVIGRLDVTNDMAFDKALAAFAEPTDGRIDVLFNNAGILSTGEFESLPLKRCHQLIDINAKGVVNGCHAARWAGCVHLCAGTGAASTRAPQGRACSCQSILQRCPWGAWSSCRYGRGGRAPGRWAGNLVRENLAGQLPGHSNGRGMRGWEAAKGLGALSHREADHCWRLR